MTAFGLLSLADHLPDPVEGKMTTQAERYRLIVESAVKAESVGFERVGLGEHHFTGHILPSPLLLLAAIAARTRTIRLGTSVTQLAALDPLRVVEDLSTLDVLSSGRAEVTFARGVTDASQAAFGIPDEATLRARFEENLRLVIRLLTEDKVTWSGRFRAPLAGVHVQPRPIQQPHPTLFVGGGLSTISCDLAADLGLPLILPSLFRYPEDYLPIVERYRARAAANGFGDRAAVGYPSYVHVARTSQEARDRWRPYLDSYARFAVSSRGSFGRPLDYEGMLAGPAICGSPAEVADRIAAINETLGLQMHYLMLDLGGLPAALLSEVLDLVGGEVLPQVRGSTRDT
jgi:alkanesulfonate monooxygenase SsuD/methylene tetrahydromethanopterin reductase-like flavin-dependent oxidoreductase (luciferase family)